MKFWDSINITNNIDECWEWKSKQGTGKRAYTSYKNKHYSASRLAWILTFGNIPENLCVCHKCDNPPCCNPNHLFLGTTQDNVNDREQKGRNKMPHSKGEEHGQHKLTKGEVSTIRMLYEKSNQSYRSLGALYGISFGAIRKIIKRETWGWL